MTTPIRDDEKQLIQYLSSHAKHGCFNDIGLSYPEYFAKCNDMPPNRLHAILKKWNHRGDWCYIDKLELGWFANRFFERTLQSLYTTIYGVSSHRLTPATP